MLLVVAVLGLCGLAQQPAAAAPVTWIGGNNNWADGGSTAFWSPADEPDPDDEAIFNTASSVSMTSNNLIQALTLSNGIDLATSDNDLDVNGLIQLSGVGTNLIIGGAASQVDAFDLVISGGEVHLQGGTLNVVDPDLVISGVATVNAGGTLRGNGAVTIDGTLISFTVFNNNGTLSAYTAPSVPGFPPPVGTLSINVGGSAGQVDLDGAAETGVITVNRNQTLEINGTVADAFAGDLDLYQGAVFDVAGSWSLESGGVITADNGAINGIPPISAGISTIAGGALTQTGGTITVVDADGTLQFDAPLTVSGGNFTNNGLVIFNADATINLVSFNFDAGDWLVQNNALLDINVNDHDSDSLTNVFDAGITLNNADLSMTSGDTEFVMNGTLEMISTAAGQVTEWHGEPLDIGDDVGALDAALNVSGSQVARFTAAVDLNSDAAVNIAAGATLEFEQPVRFDTVNGPNQASFAGAGAVSFNDDVLVNEAVTLNMVAGAVDLDGVDTAGDNQVLVDAALTINAATVTDFGRLNPGGLANVIQINAITGAGSLTVNLDDPAAEWTINPEGELNILSTAGLFTLLFGSPLNLNGTMNVTGAAGTGARLDIGGTVDLQSADSRLLLQGGTQVDPNRLEGGVILGPGELSATNARALAGYGTINAPIDFDSSSELVAEGGLLTLSGAVTDVGTIRVADQPAVLDLAQPLSTAVTDGGIVLAGGTLTGAAVTTASLGESIRGHGAVICPVINTGALQAEAGTLLCSNAASDWDGPGNAGRLQAESGAVLELNDDSLFSFGGSMVANSGVIFANGFALNFDPGSSITLSAGTFQSTHSTDIGGSVLVSAGGDATIEVQDNRFLDFETTSGTTLNGNLWLVNNNIGIAAGAAFSGSGALIVAEQSHLVADAGADLGVLLDVEGSLRLAGFDAVGRVDVDDYHQWDTGTLIAEIAGTGLNQFDRLVVFGIALLDGTLEIDFDNFTPAPGDAFSIISAINVFGTFDQLDVSDLPQGLSLEVVYQPTFVQVVVVQTLPGDCDGDGDVDLADHAELDACLGGPDVGLGPDCGCFDFDFDGDVDLADFAGFQASVM